MCANHLPNQRPHLNSRGISVHIFFYYFKQNFLICLTDIITIVKATTYKKPSTPNHPEGMIKRDNKKRDNASTALAVNVPGE